MHSHHQIPLCDLSLSVFCSPDFCPLPKTGGSDENGRNSDSAFYSQNQGLCCSDPEIDENDENGGKMTVAKSTPQRAQRSKKNRDLERD